MPATTNGNGDFVTTRQLGQVKGDVTKVASKLNDYVTKEELVETLTSAAFQDKVDERVTQAVKEMGAEAVAAELLNTQKLREQIQADIAAAVKSEGSATFVGRSINWTADKLAPESQGWNTTIKVMGWATFACLCLEGIGFALNLPQLRPSTYAGKLIG